MNFIFPVIIFAFVIVLLYVVLPKFVNNHLTEKIIKILLFLTGAGYVGYDLYLKEKTIVLAVLAIGSALFMYIMLTAKKK